MQEYSAKVHVMKFDKNSRLTKSMANQLEEISIGDVKHVFGRVRLDIEDKHPYYGGYALVSDWKDNLMVSRYVEWSWELKDSVYPVVLSKDHTIRTKDNDSSYMYLAHNGDPVSYTHLTLPTSRLV